MEINLLVVSAIVVGLVQMAKEFKLPKRILVVLTMLIAIAVMVVAAPILKVDGWRNIILTGIIVGLQAMGLYSGGKNLIEKE